ncbi:MAG: YncE family protein [Thermoanaerobaculia bacterium]
MSTSFSCHFPWVERLGRGAGFLLVSSAFALSLLAAPAEAVAPVGALFPALLAASATAPVALPRYVKDGLAAEAELLPLGASGKLEEGTPVEVRLRLKDATTGEPLSGSYPAAWLDRVPDPAAEAADACKEKIQTFLSGSLLSKPETDLNAYFVLGLNADPSITVVDPLFSYGGSKLLAELALEAPGEDWAVTPDATQLFVSMPDVGKVAVFETASWKSMGAIATGGRPMQLLLQQDGRYLWVGVEGEAGGAGSVLALDTARRAVVGRFALGGGPLELALGKDDRTLLVADRARSQLVAIDVASLAVSGRLAVEEPPVSLAYSAVADTVYLALAGRGEILAIDARRLEVVARMEDAADLSEVRVAPGGRLGFALAQAHDRVYIFDTARNRIVQKGETEKAPDQLSFSDSLAYIRHAGSETVLMIALAGAGVEGQPIAVVDFPGGQRPFGKVSRPARARGIVAAPGEPAVLVANPADGMIYFYKEGMAAPMGSFQNYGHEPRAAAVVDRSLKERQPGVYSTVAELGPAGTLELAFFLNQPRAYHCFRFEVAEDPRLAREREKKQAVRVEYLPGAARSLPATPLAVRFRLVDRESGTARAGRHDVVALVFQVPGTWQSRLLAEPLADGSYEVRFTPRDEGIYALQIEARALGLALQESPTWSIVVGNLEPQPSQAAPASK